MTAPTLTNPSLSAGDVGGFRLPPRLRRDYDLVRMLPKRGGEAVLLQATRKSDGTQVVLKLYGRGLGLRTSVLQLVSRADVAHVVTLYDFGTDAGVGYEVLEYVPAGDLEDYLARFGTPAESEALQVVRELANAVAALHAVSDVELAHGDIKPANVLVRRREPLDLVLTDFGLATLEHDTQHRHYGTPRWSAPIAMSGFQTPEGDWWSLGAIAYWLRTGQPLAADLTDAAAAEFLSLHNADLIGLPPGERDWRLLCQGLLSRDEGERWRYRQVVQWLDGGAPPVGSQWAPPTPMVTVAAPSGPPSLRYRGREYTDLAALGIALAREWRGTAATLEDSPDDIVEPLAGFARESGDLDLAADIRGIAAAYEPVDLKVTRLVRRLSPSAPPTFQQWLVDRDGLRGLADQAAADPDSAPALSLADLFTTRALTGWDSIPGLGSAADLMERWHAGFDYWLAAAREYHGAIDDLAQRRARAAVLLALVDDGARADLTRRAERAAGGVPREVGWFGNLARRTGTSPGADYTVLTLAPTARREADAGEADRRRRANERAAAAAAEAVVRWPRTLRIGWWALAAQVGLVLCWAALRVAAPRGWLGSSDGVLRWWATSIPDVAADWLARWSDPLIVLPLVAVTLTLVLRARGIGSGSATVRHPLERTALQGAVLVTCLLIPPLIPVMLIGWYRGLQLYAPAELRRPAGITLICAGAGSATTVLTMLLLVGAAPVTDQPPVTGTAVAGPLWQATTGPVIWVRFGPWPDLWASLGTLIICAGGAAAFTASSLAFTRRNQWDRRVMWAAALPAVVGALNLPVAYLGTVAAAVGVVATMSWLAWAGLHGRG